MIKFSSRVDLYLPEDAEAKVKVGDRVLAGESIIAASPSR
jgi:phosphatidylserine decarboxylase